MTPLQKIYDDIEELIAHEKRSRAKRARENVYRALMLLVCSDCQKLVANIAQQERGSK